MSVKSELRKEVKAQRRSIADKKSADKKIADLLFKSEFYKKADTILTYVSLPDEVETDGIINNALDSGKRVAVPYCVDDNGHMEFYLITSIDDLIEGSFGVREPDIEKCKRLDNFENSVIIVPALCFDINGYRLGYGKGYYDRFLQNYPFISVGLCYNSLVKKQVPIGEYDQRVNCIITDDKILSCFYGGKNG